MKKQMEKTDEKVTETFDKMNELVNKASEDTSTSTFVEDTLIVDVKETSEVVTEVNTEDTSTEPAIKGLEPIGQTTVVEKLEGLEITIEEDPTIGTPVVNESAPEEKEEDDVDKSEEEEPTTEEVDAFEDICEMLKNNNLFSHVVAGRHLKNGLTPKNVELFYKEFLVNGATTAAESKLIGMLKQYYN